MKRYIKLVLVLSIILTSCQVEKIESEIATEDLSLTAKKKKSKKTSSFCVPDIQGLESSLPDKVSIITTSKRGVAAYFSLDILDTNLAGTNIEAWCIDIDLSLEVEGPIDFEVYSSYGVLPTGVFDKPENFDLVNWILNQNYVGSESPAGGYYTYGHVQWAIWELLENTNCRVCDNLTNPTGDWRSDPSNLSKGQEILQAALNNGENFVPGCGEQIGIILIPDGKQPLIVTKEVPTTEEECNECEGKITELELEFNGSQTANIVVKGKGKKGKKGHDAPIIFESSVNPGESFTIYGNDDKGTLGTEITIYVNDAENAKIHTSCSDPDVGPGFIEGDFKVIRGASREGGELCL